MILAIFIRTIFVQHMITLYIFHLITILVIFATYVEGSLRALTFHMTILVAVEILYV